MGTSNSNYGQNGNTPIVPSWLNDEDYPNDPNKTTPPIPQPGDGDRFRDSRGSLTRYINSKGNSRSYLRKATADYISKSLGGAGNAVARLGSAKKSTERIVSIFSGILREGLKETLSNSGLDFLIGKTSQEIYSGLIDYICPDGGTVDEGIARSAFVEALIEINKDKILDITKLNEDQLLVLLESYFSHVIMERLINDIGRNLINLPDSSSSVSNLQNQIFEFIYGAVSDALANSGETIKNITPDRVNTFVEQIYSRAYTILEIMSEDGE